MSCGKDVLYARKTPSSPSWGSPPLLPHHHSGNNIILRYEESFEHIGTLGTFAWEAFVQPGSPWPAAVNKLHVQIIRWGNLIVKWFELKINFALVLHKPCCALSKYRSRVRVRSGMKPLQYQSHRANTSAFPSLSWALVLQKIKT